ncbi:MAG: MBL fold metallo-hydrolase [Bacteriovoracaceae bacterium]|nr:MBL fold metallo-hydrolase [Bacteriovoracaceae bacterium]
MIIHSLATGGQKLDGGAMFGNVPKPLWSRWYQADELNRIDLACRPLLIKTDKLILLETGIGNFFDPKLKARFGVSDGLQLKDALHALGIVPEDIDVVVLSHLHFDHAGGLMPAWSTLKEGSGNWELNFSNAQYVTSKQQFEHAKSAHMRDRASYIPQMIEKLEQSQRLTLVERKDQGDVLEEATVEFLPNFSFLFSDGHTPGQMHALLHGSKQKLFFCGDLCPGTAWLHLPVTMGYDRYPEKTIDEKKAIFELALQQNWLLFFTHDPKVSACFLTKSDLGAFSAHSTMDKLSSYML